MAAAKKKTVHRRVEYGAEYNPIREYWEQIKYKPLFIEIEKIQSEIMEAELKGNGGAAFLIPKREKLAELEEQKRQICESQKIENTSEKVYRMYEEIMRFTEDPESEWEYNSARGNHALEFVENYCRQSKGKMGGKALTLELWEKALVAAAFGVIHKITGLRKYTEVILMVARKNGKSTLSAAIGLYLQMACLRWQNSRLLPVKRLMRLCWKMDIARSRMK